jgi:hypothetical protein
MVAPSEEQAVRRLVQRAKAGDHDGMRQLYVRFAPHVHDYVKRIVVNPDDADDLTQQIERSRARRSGRSTSTPMSRRSSVARRCAKRSLR